MPAPEQPEYRKYRAAPRLPGRAQPDGLADLVALRERQADPGRAPASDPVVPAPTPRRRGRWTWRRVLGYLVLAAVAWTALAVVLFLVSATVHQTSVKGLDGGGTPPFSATNVLVLGSDARPAGSKEPGAGGPSRSDSMLLLRLGGGANAKLSIPRDTAVDIPGHGRQKINAAYAFGGARLAVQTVKQFLGVPVDHVIEVSFTDFPDLIDAMGGVDYTGGCVVSKINGGYANGGVTLRLPAGTSHLDGKQALALARTRKNSCNPRESDLSRARRQQKLLSAMKSRVVSPAGWLRGPFIGWKAPKSIRSDMSGPTLLGLFAALATGGNAPTRVLRPSGGEVLSDGGQALTVSPASRRAAARRFMAG